MVSSISDLVKNFKNQSLDANGFTINTYKPQALNSSKLTNIKLQQRNENRSARKPRNQVSGSFHHIVFEPYWALGDVQRALNANELVKSKIRINQRNFKDAYLNDTLNDKNLDIYINSVKDRNRSLNGDIVAAKVKEKHEWKILNSKLIDNALGDFIANNHVKHEQSKCIKAQITAEPQQNDRSKSLKEITCSCYYTNKNLLDTLADSWFQKTAKIVHILEKKHTRYTAGQLKMLDKNGGLYKNKVCLSPKDSRLPRLLIDLSECPSDFKQNPEFYEKVLFIAEIIDMPENTSYAIGRLKNKIGEIGDIDAETEAILYEQGIDSSEFDEDLLRDNLPQLPWSVPFKEYTYRRDLRDKCIFTIDPTTARDLDDALHCIRLDENLFEVGVHIADVSHFIPENTYIDNVASKRTTSVYLVQKVIPMLPRTLCENLCSLNPNEERLTFSIIWHLNGNGDILSEWFGKAIIKSCAKLSYDHAQMVIDKLDDNDVGKFPCISEKFNLDIVKESILNLYTISKNLRAKRYANGCLTLNQVKISFLLNSTNKLPFAYSVYEQKDSNKLVEEFMLLANISTAKYIYDKYPNMAILRRHPSPNSKQITDLAERLKEYGYMCDTTTSNSIQAFLHELEKKNTEESRTAFITLTSMLTKTMQLAQYFCSGNEAISKESYFHYGLAVPLYTHFTSPIRRYPDILVHRLLAASLGYSDLTQRNVTSLQEIAELSNDKKSAARISHEKSTELFFSIFVNECGPLEEHAFVTMIQDHSFDVLISNLGVIKRIYCDKLEIKEGSLKFTSLESRTELSFVWCSNERHPTETKQTIKLFDKVNVILTKSDIKNDRLKYNIILKRPNESNKKTPREAFNSSDETVYVQRHDVDPYIID